MILVDANLLIYARVSTFAEHDRARAWLNEHLNGTARVGLPWVTLLAFMRIVSNPKLFTRPQSVLAAWEQVLEWLACETVWIPEPTERHAEILDRLLRQRSLPGGNSIPDIHLAALAIEHGLTVCSNDSGFGRYSGIRWMNPLA